MQRLDVSGAVRPLYGTLGVKGLISPHTYFGRLPSGNKPLCRNKFSKLKNFECDGNQQNYFLRLLSLAKFTAKFQTVNFVAPTVLNCTSYLLALSYLEPLSALFNPYVAMSLLKTKSNLL